MGTLGSFVLARIAQLENAPMTHQVYHYIRLTRKVTLVLMQVHKTVGVAKILVLSKRLNVMTEPLPAREAIEGIEAISSYGTKVACVTAANIVPPMLAPDPSIDKSELEYMT